MRPLRDKISGEVMGVLCNILFYISSAFPSRPAYYNFAILVRCRQNNVRGIFDRAILHCVSVNLSRPIILVGFAVETTDAFLSLL